MVGIQQKARFGEDPTSSKSPSILADRASPLFVAGIGGSATDAGVLANGLICRDDIAFIYVGKSLEGPFDNAARDETAFSFSFQALAVDTQLRAGCVYIASPDAYISVEEGVAKVLPPPAGRHEILPFDFLLQSLAQAYKSRSIAIILSGPGGDGSIGVSSIKEEGGLVIAQDPNEAEQQDMPCSAIAAGNVDIVLPLNTIPAAIADLDGDAYDIGLSRLHQPRLSTNYLLEIANLMHEKIAEGFIGLPPILLHRNIERRMGAFWPHLRSLQEYLTVLKSDGHELGMLMADIATMRKEPPRFQRGSSGEESAVADAGSTISEHRHMTATEMHHVGTGEMIGILNCVDAAGFVVDRHLRLCFFTPTAAKILGFEAGHIGMKIAEISLSTMMAAIVAEARLVVQTGKAAAREIAAADGTTYQQCAMPHRDANGGISGVVFGFKNLVTVEQKRELISLKRQAEIAAVARQHLLSTDHSLRQPLQTLALLHGLLARTVEAPGAQELLALAENTITAMTGMLTTLMNINYTEGSPNEVDIVAFPINDLLDHMRNEFSYHARKPQHDLKIVPCSLVVASNRPFLELIVRNFLLNAVKFTPKGKLLLGCRRRGQFLRIEVWDTGIGISASNPEEIFDDCHRDQSYHGFGLNSARRLGSLLRHHIGVRSRQGKGSVFFVDVPMAKLDMSSLDVLPAPENDRSPTPRPAPGGSHAIHREMTVYIVDDDIHFRAVLRRTLEGEGLSVEDFGSAEQFLATSLSNATSCLLIDAYLPGMSGLDLLKRLRDSGDSRPAIMITGNSDVRMAVAAMKIGAVDFIEKPVNGPALLASIERVLERLKDTNGLQAWRVAAAKQMAALSPRQHEIMRMVLSGEPSKVIAARLGISQRTVESHRATIMKKTGCKSLPELARLSLAAISTETDIAMTRHRFPRELLERLLQ